MRLICSAFAVSIGLSICSLAPAAAVKAQVQHTATGWSLLRGGQPLFIKGAGGDGDQTLLKKCGGNSIRTWGVDQFATTFPDAQKHGLTVAAGIWLEHESAQFSYSNLQQVQAQFETAKAAVEKYKDNPALLVWGVGNEMAGYKNGGDPHVWKAVEAIAKMIHKVDPNHPAMTVVAEIGGQRVPSINKYCPDIDIVGINSYGGGASVANRYTAAGGTKPYIITEFGPAGAWETGHNSWGAPNELTSTTKGDSYRATYEGSIASEQGKLCLGSYAFLWGHKQEATATWFGMFSPDNRRLEAIDVMSDLWSGHYPKVRCPQIQPLKLSRDHGPAGSMIHAALSVSDSSPGELVADWSLQSDPGVYITGGASQAKQTSLKQAITNASLTGADIKLPANKGGYWLYAEVKGPGNTAAIADAPIYCDDAGAAAAPKGAAATLPFVLYGPKTPQGPFIPSGYMGSTSAITLDPNCTDDPHDGKTCLKNSFASATNWGGVVWQTPANNWGEQPGGFDLTGAKKLTFWARGEKGGEVVSFKMGILGQDKKYHDSDSASLDNVKLTKDWKQYTIDLSGKDLSHIMTGFVWSLAAQGSSVTFYLSDIKYQ